MRQLFVPACVCLVTWAGAAALDPKLSFDKYFGGISIAEKKTEPSQNNTASPDQDAAASSNEAAGNTATRSDVPIDIPEQSAAAPTLAPERIPLPPIPKPVVHRSRSEVCDTLAKSALSNDLPLPFFIRLLFQESRFKPEVVSSAGAEGVAQFMPETSADMGLDNPFDPVQAIPASARLLRDLFHQFGNLGLAAAAYNAGPKRIQDWLAKKGKLPEETQGYVKIITGRPAETWKVAGAGNAEMRLPRRAPCQEEAGLHAWDGPDRIPMPVPSPFARTAAGPIRAAMQSTNAAAKITRPVGRMTAAIKIGETAKPSAAHGSNGAVQLAARKRPADKAKPDGKQGKLARNTAGMPVRVAAAVARGAHK